jgi:hypothetical protein
MGNEAMCKVLGMGDIQLETSIGENGEHAIDNVELEEHIEQASSEPSVEV